MPIKKTDSIAALMPVAQFEEEDYLLMATQEGLIKKTPLSQFQDVRANGLIAMKLKVLLLLPLSQLLLWSRQPVAFLPACCRFGELDMKPIAIRL